MPRRPSPRASLLSARKIAERMVIVEASAALLRLCTAYERTDFISQNGANQYRLFDGSRKRILFRPADLQASLNS